MSKAMHQCQCSHCQREDEHPDQLRHRQINLTWTQGVGSGVGGTAGGSSPIDGRWTAGGGKKTPQIIDDLIDLVEEFSAGDPMRERKWVRLSLSQLTLELGNAGYAVSPTTISRLLNESDYALRANMKSQEPGSNHPDRNRQFESIAQTKDTFQEAGLPVISVDTKKKELIGDFKNAGRVWCREAEQVNGHDFPSQSEGHAVPYGIYDLSRNRATVGVGKSADGGSAPPSCSTMGIASSAAYLTRPVRLRLAVGSEG